MLKLKKSNERGYADHGWLKSYHSFSFANYYNPNQMHLSHLRVINDDIIAPTYGFGQHPHNNMEIFTYVLEGQLAHKDTMDNGSVIKAGDVQLMSTGYGVEHSEFNASDSESVRLLQIWVIPNQKNTLPTYQQEHFTTESKLNKLKLIISEDGRNNSMVIKQDLSVYASILEIGKSVDYTISAKRSVYIQIASGSAIVSGITLNIGDALEVTNEQSISISAISDVEFLLFDLIEF